MIRKTSTSTLFPYTTLFRSRKLQRCVRKQFAIDFRNGATAFGPLRKSIDRKSTRLNSSHVSISYAVFCLKKKTIGGQTAKLAPQGIDLGRPVEAANPTDAPR